jgi:hypothetical protein
MIVLLRSLLIRLRERKGFANYVGIIKLSSFENYWGFRPLFWALMFLLPRPHKILEPHDFCHHWGEPERAPHKRYFTAGAIYIFIGASLSEPLINGTAQHE